MYHFLRIVNVSKSFNDLFEEELGNILLQSSPLLDVREQISARAEFDDEANVLFCLECIVQFDDIGLITLFQNTHLEFCPPLEVFFTLKIFLAHRFNRHKLLTELMQSKRHFSKGALAKDAPDPVELTRCRWSSLELLEVQPYHFA